MAKQIIVLGATGDIGRQCLEILRYSYDYKLVGVSLCSHYELLEDNLFWFDSLEYVAIEDENKAKEFALKHPTFAHRIFSGVDSSLKLIKAFPKATVFNSISGNAGLKPTLLAMKQNQDILLSNKESIVIGSSLICELSKNYQGKIYPVDSEHVGLYKVFDELKQRKIPSSDIVYPFITASGGALRDVKRENYDKVTKEMVLKHPTWRMSNKITVDCATLVNKGYEIIEASYLFNYSVFDISAMICRSSLIHAGVVYLNDKGEKEYLVEYSPCSMKNAIAFALSKGEKKIHHLDSDEEKECQKEIDSLEVIDCSKYPLFALTINCFDKYGNSGMIYYNAVDCIAIDQFLKGEITFLEIEESLKFAYINMPRLEELTEDNLDEILDDSENFAIELFNNKPWRSR